MKQSFSSPALFAGLLAAVVLAPALVHAEPELYDRQYDADYDRRDVRLPGEVSRVWGRNSIELRSGSRYYSVRLTGDADSTFLNVGDYVILRGEWDGSTFVSNNLGRGRAEDWNRSVDSRRGDRLKVDFPGTISRILSSKEVEVRGDNDRYYKVDVWSGISGLSLNSRVRVVGESTGQRIKVERLYPSYSGTTSTSGAASVMVNFEADVVRVDTVKNVATVRAGNGRNYAVLLRNFKGVRAGDRIRVAGPYQNSVVAAASLAVIR